MRHRIHVPFRSAALCAAIAVAAGNAAVAGERPEFPLSVAEARERAEARFQTLDTDGSGELSEAEFAAAAEGDRWDRHAFRHRLEHDRKHRGGPGGAQGGPDGRDDRGADADGTDHDDAEAAVFDRLDADGDGQLSREEFTPEKRHQARRTVHQARVFERLDTDDSGGLSRAELPDPSEWLEAMDSDGDGMVTRAEAREHRHHGKRSG